MLRRLLLAALAMSPGFIAAGCKHCCQKCSSTTRPSPYLPPPPGSVIGPPSGANFIPPAGVPTTPGAGGGALPPPDVLSPRNFGPPPEINTKPGGPDVLLPDALPGGASSRPVGPTTGIPPFLLPPTKATTSEPPVLKPSAAPQMASAGLPGYTKVKDGVFTGRKPELEGFDTLKRNGFRTLVYLHGTNADVSAARDLADKRGLTFVAIETTPETLPEALDQLNKQVVNAGSKPMYVYDDDGMRTGAVFYLHLRTVDAMNADAARVRARAIGLTDQTEDGKAFWVAINQFLSR